MRPTWITQHVAALRALLVFTVLLGLAYPLAITAVALIPGLNGRAEGSLVTGTDGETAGSSLIGQSFTDPDGEPLVQYFQSRPSAAGDGYDPTSTGASNLGPESVVDVLSADPEEASASLLSQVCARSVAVGTLEGVDGSRPFCTPDGVGAVLGVYRDGGFSGRITRVVSLNEACPATPFLTTYQGATVQCARVGEDYAGAVATPIRGEAAADAAVPSDAVAASGSGLDPQISPEYAQLQIARIARERGAKVTAVQDLVEAHTSGRSLGFLGGSGVNVVELNLDLDRQFPARS
jgi:potassium-transporting ATPase KdpC subunit